MKTNPRPDDVDVYIFTLDGVRDFWVAAGRGYAHFALVDGEYRFIRAGRLPGRALGYAVQMKAAQARRLQAEAARHGLALAPREAGETYVYDRALPAGVLTVEGFAFLSESERSG